MIQNVVAAPSLLESNRELSPVKPPKGQRWGEVHGRHGSARLKQGTLKIIQNVAQGVLLNWTNSLYLNMIEHAMCEFNIIYMQTASSCPDSDPQE